MEALHFRITGCRSRVHPSQVSVRWEVSVSVQNLGPIREGVNSLAVELQHLRPTWRGPPIPHQIARNGEQRNYIDASRPHLLVCQICIEF